MDNIDRIWDVDYIPSNQDMLMARSPTKGVNEQTVMLGNKEYTIYDVGGQKSLRYYWIPYFEMALDAIIYITAISSYDQVIFNNKDDGGRSIHKQVTRRINYVFKYAETKHVEKGFCYSTLEQGRLV